VQAYDILTAWALTRYGIRVGNDGYVQAGVRNGEWLCSIQDSNGWFPYMNFDIGHHPLTHTVAYTIRGLLELGVLTGRQDFIDAATVAARKMLALQDGRTGAVPGQIMPPYEAAVSWINTTGAAQMAIVWFRLHQITGDHLWREAACRTNEFNCSLQDMRHRNPGCHGGLRGSYPGYAGYGQFWYMSWTMKFHLDALLAEMGATVM
jgi:uncharacterized protein YyaL (SSP411 family)